MIRLFVYGVPAPQGSKRHLGNGVMVESSKALKPWRQDVRQAVLDALPDGHTPWTGPIHVQLTFTFPRPKGHWRTGRNAHLLRDAAPAYPAGAKDDLDKLCRGVFDAVTSAGLWGDDGQVVRLDARKLYLGHPDALDRPGCDITAALWTVDVGALL